MGSGPRSLAQGNAAARTAALAIGAQAVTILAAKGKVDECVMAAASVIKPLLATMATETSAKAVKLDDDLLLSATSSQGWTNLLLGLATDKSVTGASVRVAIGALSVILSVLPELVKLAPHGWIGASPAAADSPEARYREFLRTTFIAVVSRPSDLTGCRRYPDRPHVEPSQWLSDINAVARSRCLLSFQALVKHAASGKPNAVNDYQTVLPSLLVALLDDDAGVRGAAAACIQALKSVYPASKGKKAHRKSKGDNAEAEQDIYMYDEFYGPTSDRLQYLPLDVAAMFVHQLASQSDVLAEDAYAVKHQLAAILNKGHVGGDASVAKLNTKARESVVAFLLAHVTAADGVLAQFQISLLESDGSGYVAAVCVAAVPADCQPCQEPGERGVIAGGSDKHFNALLKFVKGVTKIPSSKFADWSAELRAKAYLQQVSFECLTADFVASLGSQQALAGITQCLFDVATLGNSYFVPGATKATLRDLFSKVPLDPATVAESLAAIAGKISQDDSDGARSGKRARGSQAKSPVDVTAGAVNASRVCAVLGAAVSESDPGPCSVLAAVGLGRIAGGSRPKELVSIDYLKQLVLTMLTRIFDEANKAGALIEESVPSLFSTRRPVLHHVMAIFTFMGANVLRQDDEYSFRVIHQTLEKVIPPLVKAKPGEQAISKREEVALAGPILRVFVDTLSHIPRHRRMALFTSLVKSLGVKTKGEGSSIDDQEDIYSFTLSLVHEFDALQQPRRRPPADDSELESAAAELYIDLPRMNSKQLRTYRLVVLDFVHKLLTSQQFRSKYRATDITPEVSQQLSSAVSTVLELITKMATQYGTADAAAAPDDAGIGPLMDRRSFVQTVAKLLAQSDYKIRRKVLALAHKRIEAFDTRLYEADAKPIDDMLELVGSVMEIVDEKTEDSAEGFSQKEFVANKQAALLCVAAAARRLGSLRPVVFTKLVKRVSGPESLDSPYPVVVSAALVTVAVLCSELGSRLIPSLPICVPVVEDKAGESDDESEGTALDSLHSQVLAKVDVLLTALAKNIPTRQLLPAQFAFYQKEACKQGPAVIVPFVQFVGKTGGSVQRTQLLQFYKPLFKFFLSVFDLARNPSIPVIEARAIEDTTLDAFMRFVVKLSENLFKPLFLSFVDWATTDPLLLSAPTPALWFASEARLRVFFRVLNVLFDKLKSIITPYYSSVIDVAIAQLTRFGVEADSVEMQDREDREEKPVPSMLWQAIVRSVYQSALHDTSDFWTEDTFNKVCKPLVAQLGNTKVAEGDAQLAVAVSNDAMWKRINMDVMMKSRADAPAVRVGALIVQQAFYDKLGEEFLILLPETIPYLAELLEDDDHRVERATQETIKTIESYLGESLQSYLR
ncbi:BP28CT-domain-containing protein [Linderina pennispora]|uniref:U3 small nucleolar RNA-associated protein 10 n=1 Tax=Linderina pennispora TaxID=61395 RepID=A0A1Y1WK23_9FUNG|nr:BP28CT-domain-containing protein [Linderina pennispora]ORX73887.1 BP28CT-domain-containing protein [Linderina pennispora]